MARPPRASIGGLVYHVLNRANVRMQIFECDNLSTWTTEEGNMTKKKFLTPFPIKQGRSSWQFLQNAIYAHYFQTSTPSLLPQAD